MVTESFVKAKMWALEISLTLLPILLSGAALLVSATSAQAAGKAIPHGTLELISENPWVAVGHWVNLGLRFQLEKGWHIYWINPGDSGGAAPCEVVAASRIYSRRNQMASATAARDIQRRGFWL